MMKRERKYFKAYAGGESGNVILMVFYTLRTFEQLERYMQRVYFRKVGEEADLIIVAATDERTYTDFIVYKSGPFTDLEYKRMITK